MLENQFTDAELADMQAILLFAEIAAGMLNYIFQLIFA